MNNDRELINSINTLTEALLILTETLQGGTREEQQPVIEDEPDPASLCIGKAGS